MQKLKLPIKQFVQTREINLFFCFRSSCGLSQISKHSTVMFRCLVYATPRQSLWHSCAAHSKLSVSTFHALPACCARGHSVYGGKICEIPVHKAVPDCNARLWFPLFPVAYTGKNDKTGATPLSTAFRYSLKSDRQLPPLSRESASANSAGLFPASDHLAARKIQNQKRLFRMKQNLIDQPADFQPFQ